MESIFIKSKSEWQNMKPGLERIQAACKQFGNPQNLFPTIHIAGTNGKGSTAAMLQSILTQAGYKVGLFTSPHLLKINERFRIGYEDISDEKLEKLIPPTPLDLSFFELCTLLAFLYFAQEKVDMAIIEVGLGGRLDSTNIITPLISVITEISLDHTEFLGSDIASIAKEKAGIIKEGVPVVCGATDPEAIEVIQKIAKENKSVFYPISSNLMQKKEGREDPAPTGLLGIHQIHNANIAIKTIEILHQNRSFAITPNDIKQGMEKVQWPGRLEIIQKNPLIVLDGAHNVAGIKAIVGAIHELPSLASPHWKILFSAASDKNVQEMLEELSKLSNEIYLCKMENSRSIDPENINPPLTPPLLKGDTGGFKTQYQNVGFAQTAYLQLSQSLQQNEALLVIGSLYLLGEIKKGL